MVTWPSLSWQQLHSVMSALASLVQHIVQVAHIWHHVKTLSTGKTTSATPELPPVTNTVQDTTMTTEECSEECKECQVMEALFTPNSIGGKHGN